jgi:hypothetical protein
MNEDQAERVSLSPLTPEQALRALLAVRPDDDTVDDEDQDDNEEAPTE